MNSIIKVLTITDKWVTSSIINILELTILPIPTLGGYTASQLTDLLTHDIHIRLSINRDQ